MQMRNKGLSACQSGERKIELWRQWKSGKSFRWLARETGISKSWIARSIKAVNDQMAVADPNLEYWSFHESEQ